MKACVFPMSAAMQCSTTKFTFTVPANLWLRLTLAAATNGQANRRFRSRMNARECAACDDSLSTRCGWPSDVALTEGVPAVALLFVQHLARVSGQETDPLPSNPWRPLPLLAR